MQIHNLNTKALTNPAYVAFDDGTDTYKADFKAEIDNAAADAVADADLTDNTVAFTSGDAASPTGWTAVDVLTSGLSLKTLLNRISTMIKNVRYIWSKIGTASMGTTATTITGAIAEHETDISGLNSNLNIPSYFLAMAAKTNITIPVAPDSSLQISWFIGNEPKGIVLLRIPANSTLATLYLGDSSNIKPGFSYGDGNLTIQNNASAFFRGIVLSTRKLSL